MSISNYNESAVAVIVDFFKKKGLNDFAICGILGNLYVESKLYPNNLQTRYEKELGMTDDQYMHAVDNYDYHNFDNDHAGWGLAQWTSPGRKKGFHEYCQSRAYSIGSLQAQLEYIWKELTEAYTKVLAVLEAGETVEACARSFMTGFEKPGDQSEENQLKRVGFAQDFCEKYFLTIKEEVKEENKPMKTVVLDPGHVGDKYNHSPVVSAYYESVFTWKWAISLKAKLEARGVHVILTRDRYTDVNLVTRGKMAQGADLFISGHSNACGTESVDRVCAIFLCNDNTTDADEKSKEIAQILATTAKNVMGVSQAKTYYKVAGYDRNKNGILTDDEYYGVLFGAHEVKCPGVILEHSFHTNKKAATWLLNDDNIDTLCEAEAEKIVEWLGMEIISLPIEEKTELVEAMTYTVKKGDILGEIAGKYGVSVDDIMMMNPDIRDKNRIYIGQKITIIKSSHVRTYTVKANDTLYKIGKNLGVSWLKIASKNRISFPYTIYPGEALVIP